MRRTSLAAFVVGIVLPSVGYFVWQMWRAGWIQDLAREVLREISALW